MTSRSRFAAPLALLVVTSIGLAAACNVSQPTTSASSSVPAASSEPLSSAALASVAPTPSPTPTLEPAATPEPTATPTPTPAPTPTPWKTYRSKRNHYKMQYPPDWVVTPGSAKLSDQFDDYGTHYVYADRDTVSGTVSVSLTVTHDIAYEKSHYKAKLLTNRKITLAHGYVGRILTFNGTANGRKVYIQHIIVGRGRVGYFLDMYSDRGNKSADKTLFRKFYRSWRPT